MGILTMCSPGYIDGNPDPSNEISMNREDGSYRLKAGIFLPRPRPDVFAYFSDARNLEAITPPWLRFRIITPLPVLMRRSARILYRLSLHGVPIRWETEITAWEPPFRFVDEQRRGPYLEWRHEHVFEDCPGGCMMTDSVRYSVWGGMLVHSLFVKRDVCRIFRYRAQILQKIFNPAANRDAGGDSRDVAP